MQRNGNPKKDQKEMQGIKDTVTKMKNAFYGLVSRLYTTERNKSLS